MNHAEDRLAFVDLTFVPLMEALAPRLPTIERYVVFTDADAHAGDKLKNRRRLRGLDRRSRRRLPLGEFDENTAAGLCYTSGTTGNPKGVLYSHRSNLLHSLISAGLDCLPVGANSTVMPVVPMFHANSWGSPSPRRCAARSW